jgi:hypothetical protein
LQVCLEKTNPLPTNSSELGDFQFSPVSELLFELTYTEMLYELFAKALRVSESIPDAPGTPKSFPVASKNS